MTTYTAQTPTGLLPVPKTRTIKAKDGRVSEKLRYDVEAYGTNEIRKLLIQIAGEETAAQIGLDNPPAFTSVDGTRGRSISSAQRRITVSFGQRLKMQALNDLKRGLQNAILSSTTKVSGTLSNMANWEFRYVHNGRRAALPVSGASGIPMGPRDFIVLMPTNVSNKKSEAYATAVNMRVAGTGKLSFRRTANSRVTAKNQGIGFLALASRAARASASFAGFNVSAGFSSRYALLGEVVHNFGPRRTGFIKISPKVGRFRG